MAKLTKKQLDEFVLVIDSLRSINLTNTKDNTIVLAVEDPNTIAIVEMTRYDLAQLRNEIDRRLAVKEDDE